MKPPQRIFRLLLAALGFAVIACGGEPSGEKKAKIERTHATIEFSPEQSYADTYEWKVDLLEEQEGKLIPKRAWTAYMLYDSSAMIPDDIHVSFDFWKNPMMMDPEDTANHRKFPNYIHISVQLVSSLREDCLDPVNAKTTKEYFLTKEALVIYDQDILDEAAKTSSIVVNHDFKFELKKAMRENSLMTEFWDELPGNEKRRLSQILVNVYAGKSPELKKHILKSQYANPICVGFDLDKEYRVSGV